MNYCYEVIIQRINVKELFCFVVLIMIVRDSESFFLKEKKCVFFGDFNVTTPQRCSTPHTHTLTNTLTFTHTHGWPTVASRSSGSRVFFGFCKLVFLTKSGQQNIFGPTGGHATSKNIFLRVCKMFHLFMYVYVCRHFAANLEV